MAGGGKHTWRSGSAPRIPVELGRPESGGNDPCDINFQTTLNSVDSAVIQDVSRGNKLPLSVENENEVPRLVAFHHGSRVGVIAHPKTLEVINCIAAGNSYAATVVERQGNICRVHVERQTS